MKQFLLPFVCLSFDSVLKQKSAKTAEKSRLRFSAATVMIIGKEWVSTVMFNKNGIAFQINFI